MKLIACDPIIGLPRIPPDNYCPDKNDLLSEMTRLGISCAIVRHRAAYEAGPAAGNHVVIDEVAGCKELLPAWLVTPDGFEPDFDQIKMIDNMLQSNVRVCWTDPEAETFGLLPWCSGPLYEVLQARRVPLLIDYDKVRPDHLDRILIDFPGLPLILLKITRLGRHRMVYPLLKRHKNLWLCLNQIYSVHSGIEDLCRHFGYDRWVFGMGYPESEGGLPLRGLIMPVFLMKVKNLLPISTLNGYWRK